MAHALDNSASSTLVLISGDRLLAYALSILRLRCYRVVVIAPDTAHPSILAHASLSFNWVVDVLNPTTTSATDTSAAGAGASTKDQFQPRGPPILCDSCQPPLDSSNFKFPKPPQPGLVNGVADSDSSSYLDNPQLRLRPARATSKRRNLSETFTSPLLSKEVPLPQVPSLPVPPTRTFATRAVSTDPVPILPPKVYESRATSPVTISDVPVPLFVPKAIKPIQEPVQISILPTPPYISEQVSQDSEPPRRTDIASGGRECWGLQDLQRYVQERAETLKSPMTDSTIGERSQNPTLPIKPSLPSKPPLPSDSLATTPHFTRPPSLSSIKASDSWDSTSQATEGPQTVVQSSPSNTSVSLLSRPMPTPTSSPAITRKVLNSSIPAAARVPPGPPTVVPPAFKPLVKALHHMRRSRDSVRPLQRAVAGAMNSTKETYQAAGVDRFPPYLNLAKEQGLVDVGGSTGKEWVSLRPDWLFVPYE